MNKGLLNKVGQGDDKIAKDSGIMWRLEKDE